MNCTAKSIRWHPNRLHGLVHIDRCSDGDALLHRSIRQQQIQWTSHQHQRDGQTNKTKRKRRGNVPICERWNVEGTHHREDERHYVEERREPVPLRQGVVNILFIVRGARMQLGEAGIAMASATGWLFTTAHQFLRIRYPSQRQRRWTITTYLANKDPNKRDQ